MATNDFTKYICLFHDAGRGRSALEALQGAGFSQNDITVLGNLGSGYDTSRTAGYDATSTSTSGYNASATTASEYSASSNDTRLESLGAPDRDLKHLRDGLNKGGVILSLEAPESRSSEIERIFHRYSADKIDEADVQTGSAFAAPVPVRNNEAVLAAEGAVVPVVEEELVVGKREVERGGVKVFRRVVEEPVTQSVNLHSEQVTIDRRSVDRPVTDADVRAGDQTIELVETAEVPVVAKVARVVEEVRVGIQESDRTETIKDTVRHTEVDVEPVQESRSTTTKSY